LAESNVTELRSAPAPISLHGGASDLTDQTFGRLVALYPTRVKRGIHWYCQCACGKHTTVGGGHLRKGRTRSCGCLQKELVSERTKQMHKDPDFKKAFMARNKKQSTDPVFKEALSQQMKRQQADPEMQKNNFLSCHKEPTAFLYINRIDANWYKVGAGQENRRCKALGDNIFSIELPTRIAAELECDIKRKYCSSDHPYKNECRYEVFSTTHIEDVMKLLTSYQLKEAA